MKEKITFQNSKGQKLVGDLYSPETETNKVAIFCHGYGSTKESSKVLPVAENITKEGIAMFAFDLTDLGESETKFEDSTITQYIDDLRCAIDLFPDKIIAVIANSLGGIVSLQQTAKDKRIKALVLQSPVSIFPHKKTGDYSEENIKQWKEKGFIMTKRGRFGFQKINYSFYEDGLRYGDYSVYDNIKVPVLVIHGTADQSIDIARSKELIKHLENNRFIILEGADHRYTNPDHFNKVIEETSKFLIEVLK